MQHANSHLHDVIKFNLITDFKINLKSIFLRNSLKSDHADKYGAAAVSRLSKEGHQNNFFTPNSSRSFGHHFSSKKSYLNMYLCKRLKYSLFCAFKKL